jgi:hypothetical protein
MKLARSLNAAAALAALCAGTGIAGCDDGEQLSRLATQIGFDQDAIDVGPVALGETRYARTRIENKGSLAFRIDTVTASAPFSLRNPGEAGVADLSGVSLAPAGGIDLEVGFTPATEGPDNGTLVLTGEHIVATLPLHGTGIGAKTGGSLACSPDPIDFGIVQRGQLATSTVTCTFQDQSGRFVGASLPDGLNGLFTLPATPPAMPLGARATVSFPVVFNPFGVARSVQTTLSVDYDGGAGLMGTAIINILAVVAEPPPAANSLGLVLTWDTDHSDLDIHLTEPGARPFTVPGDCYFHDKNPAWGPTPAVQPALDRDVTTGYGPEHLNLMKAAVPGNYEVWVHYYADTPGRMSVATVVVNFHGRPAAIRSMPLICNKLWHVGTVGFDETGEATVFTPNDQISMSNVGECL